MNKIKNIKKYTALVILLISIFIVSTQVIIKNKLEADVSNTKPLSSINYSLPDGFYNQYQTALNTSDGADNLCIDNGISQIFSLPGALSTVIMCQGGQVAAQEYSSSAGTTTGNYMCCPSSNDLAIYNGSSYVCCPQNSTGVDGAGACTNNVGGTNGQSVASQTITGANLSSSTVIQQYFAAKVNGACPTTATGGGTGCAVTCNNDRTFSDSCPLTFPSCEVWAAEACNTVSSSPKTISGSLDCKSLNTNGNGTGLPPETGGPIRDNSCVPQFPDCGAGFTNLAGKLADGTLTYGGWGTTNDVIGKIVDFYNTNNSSDPNYYKKVCIADQYKSLFTSYEGGTVPTNQIGMYTSFGGATSAVVRLCPADTRPSQARDIGAIPGAWGCCPSNYIFVTASDFSFATEVQNSGGCCPSGSGAAFLQGGKCLTSSKTAIPGATPLTGSQYTHGVAFGSIDGSTLKQTNDVPLNQSVCDKGYDRGCLITSTSLGANSTQIPSDLTNADPFAKSGYYITSTGVYTPGSAVAAQCIKCITSGTEIGEQGNNLLLCDNGKIRTVENVGGSVDITKGYLLEEGDNQALYKQCFDNGGIYTAIGCIDPTPTGIITGIIRIALGIMGGVALLQMIYVGILYQQGKSDKIQGARTQLIATITGIAILVFAVLILRIIGINILDTVSNGSV